MPLGPVLLSDNSPYAKEARARWAMFIKKVFAADQLVCPECGKRRIALLVDGVRMACRRCLGVNYRMQSMGPYARSPGTSDLRS
jgi:hypothetical protein